MKNWIFLLFIISTMAACTSDSSASKEVSTPISTPSTPTTTTSKTEKEMPPENKQNTIIRKKPVRLGTAPARLHLQEKIEKMHENLMHEMESQAGINPKDVAEYEKESVLYMSIYGDSLAAEYAFNAADLYQGIGDYKKAIETW
ncbi:MAG TPA: hypothetical protein ENJ53_07635, partial [Phaeodactylibacter sp.]|nr:hypothetical protein [Phaeodactylibacter sp.]